MATGIAILLLLLGLTLVLFLLVNAVGELSSYLSDYSGLISSQATQLDIWLADHGLHTPSSGFSFQIIIDNLLKLIYQILTKLGSFLSVIALAVVACVFMLFEAPNFQQRFSSKFDTKHDLLFNMKRFITGTREFIVVTTLVGAIEGVIIAVALHLLHVPFPITWGVTFWLLNYIPYLGIWLAVIPPALIASIELGSPYGFIVVLIYIVVSNVFKLLVLPKMMGNKVDTSMTVGFLGLFFWGAVLGIFGVLLAYPYTLLVRDVLLTSHNELWLAEFMRKGNLQ